MNQIDEQITNCMDCKFHRVINDPDPHDWFNDDDEAVMCTLTEGNPNHDESSLYRSTRQNVHRCVTVSCRPYSKRSECEIPDWCPKLPKSKNPIEQISDSIATNMEAIRAGKPCPECSSEPTITV